MVELFTSVIEYVTYAIIALCRFFEPLTTAMINYYKDAFETGNPAVIIFTVGISLCAYYQIGSAIKWCFCKVKRNA